MKELTKLIHNPINKLYNTYNVPIIKCSTIFQENLKSIKNHNNRNIITYGIHSSITNKCLENIINTLENSKYTIICPSGLISLYIIYTNFIKYKSIVLIPKNAYNPNFRILKLFKKKFNIKVIIYSYNNNIKYFKKIINKFKYIKLILIENPGSITLNFYNIKTIIEIANKHKITTVIDNTYSIGGYFKPINNNIDISVNALTKYISGYNDIIMGSISTNIKLHYKNLIKLKQIMGINNNIEDINQIIKSSIHSKYRYIKQSITGYKIVKWINKYFKNIKLYYPVIRSYNNRKLFKLINKIPSSIFSLQSKKKIFFNEFNKLINKLNLFKLGYSWGGITSTIMIYKNIIRISIGLEKIKDLKKDLNKILFYLNNK